MPTVNFFHRNGTVQKVQVDAGVSLMESARSVGVNGIDGECGGNLSCATCHIYVDEAWFDKLGPIGDIENDLLDATASPRRPGSRLSCQITMNEELNDMRVYVPESQF